jgi:PIN domain nuclease of toxin-antitoxin system
MPNEFAVDAHALIWLAEGNPLLSANALAALQGASNRLYLPIIALAEACWAVAKGKTGIASAATLLAGLDADSRWAVMPLDRAILDCSLSLTAISEMHDRLIAATALQLGGSGGKVPLVTRDPDITASGLVPVLW